MDICLSMKPEIRGWNGSAKEGVSIETGNIKIQSQTGNIQQSVSDKTDRKGFPMADSGHHDRRGGGLVKGADFPGTCGGICAQPDPGIRVHPGDFSCGGTSVPPLLCVPSGEYPSEELLFSPVRSENSVPSHEADLPQGPGG